jgi:hypothetical protein
MSSLPVILILSGLALTVYKLVNRITPEDFLIQDPTSSKITDQSFIDQVRSGAMSHEGRINRSQFW